MSDFSPDPRQRPDPLNYRPEYTYEPVGGRSSFAVMGLVAALALIGGLLFFGWGDRPNDQQAMQPPPAVTDVPATPTPAPANPAPAAPRQ